MPPECPGPAGHWRRIPRRGFKAGRKVDVRGDERFARGLHAITTYTYTGAPFDYGRASRYYGRR